MTEKYRRDNSGAIVINDPNALAKYKQARSALRKKDKKIGTLEEQLADLRERIEKIESELWQ